MANWISFNLHTGPAGGSGAVCREGSSQTCHKDYCEQHTLAVTQPRSRAGMEAQPPIVPDLLPWLFLGRQEWLGWV